MPTDAQKRDFEAISDFPGVPKPTVGRSILPKNRLFGFLLSSGTAHEANLVAIWRRKRPKTTQGSNLIDFLMNLDSFGIDFL